MLYSPNLLLILEYIQQQKLTADHSSNLLTADFRLAESLQMLPKNLSCVSILMIVLKHFKRKLQNAILPLIKVWCKFHSNIITHGYAL